VSGRPRPWPAVAFSVALLSPLADAPGFGPWGVRLPLLAAAGAALLFDLARGPASRPGPLGCAVLALLAVHVASAFAAQSWEAVPPLVVHASGVVLYFHAAGGRLPGDFARSTLPVLLSVLGLVFSGAGLAQALLGREAVSTLWNRNYSGTLAAMLLPVSGALAAGPGARRVRALHGGAMLGLFAYLAVTDSRAGLLAAAAGAVVAALALLRSRGRRALVAGALALPLFAVVPLAFRGGRALSAERMETVAVRRGIWTSAARMLADRPLLGVGLGSFAAAYPPYRSFEEARLSHAHETRGFKEVEDPHSSWVQAAVETGPLGLAAWAALVLLGARAWVRRLRDSDDPSLLAGLGAGAAAFLVGGCFNTLTVQPAHAALFWACLGSAQAAAPPPPPPPIGDRRRTLLAGLAVLALFGTGAGVVVAGAERSFVAAMSSSTPAVRLAELDRAIGIDRRSWRAHEARAAVLLSLGRPVEAREAAEKALELRPNAAASMNNRAVAMLRTGAAGEAEAALRGALERAPHCWLTHLNLGALEFERNRPAEAERHYARAELLAPRMPQLPYRRAETFLVRGDPAAALEPLRRAAFLGYDVAGALRREHPARASDPGFAEFFR